MENNSTLDIFSYQDAQQFLKDAWREKRKANPSFSLRAWANKLGLKHNAPLSLMMAGKRAIPRKYVPRLIETLALSAKEGLYLETLICLSSAKTLPEKGFYQQRLRSLSPDSAVRMVEVESFKYLGNPIHTIVLEMTDLPGFKSDPKWIKSRLSFETSVQEVEEVIERLIGLGLLQELPDGKLRKTHKHITNRPDVADKGSQEYHKNISHLAAKTITSQHLLNREFNGYSMNIARSALPRAKKLIREFAKEFVAQIESPPENAEETYQLNLQFFALTQERKESLV